MLFSSERMINRKRLLTLKFRKILFEIISDCIVLIMLMKYGILLIAESINLDFFSWTL